MEGARGADGAARAAARLRARGAAIPSGRRRDEGLDPGEGTVGGGSVGQEDDTEEFGGTRRIFYDS